MISEASPQVVAGLHWIIRISAPNKINGLEFSVNIINVAEQSQTLPSNYKNIER